MSKDTRITYQFDPEFVEQLKKAYTYRAPRGEGVARPVKPPLEKQILWLRKFNKEIPATMQEASAILDLCFNKGGKR